MIEIKQVSFTYDNATNGTAIQDINVQIPKGQIVLLCGESGSGKTTFSRLINGLIPAYYDGDLNGRVMVSQKDTSKVELHELAPVIGSVKTLEWKKQIFWVVSTVQWTLSILKN